MRVGFGILIAGMSILPAHAVKPGAFRTLRTIEYTQPAEPTATSRPADNNATTQMAHDLATGAADNSTMAPNDYNVCKDPDLKPGVASSDILAKMGELEKQNTNLFLFLPIEFKNVIIKVFGGLIWSSDPRKNVSLLKDAILKQAAVNDSLKETFKDAKGQKELNDIATKIAESFADEATVPDDYRVAREAYFQFGWKTVQKKLSELDLPCINTEAGFKLVDVLTKDFMNCLYNGPYTRDGGQLDKCMSDLESRAPYYIGQLGMQMKLLQKLHEKDAPKFSEEKLSSIINNSINEYDACAGKRILNGANKQINKRDKAAVKRAAAHLILEVQTCAAEGIVRSIKDIAKRALNEKLVDYIPDPAERKKVAHDYFFKMDCKLSGLIATPLAFDEDDYSRIENYFKPGAGSDLLQSDIEDCVDSLTRVAGHGVAERLLDQNDQIHDFFTTPPHETEFADFKKHILEEVFDSCLNRGIVNSKKTKEAVDLNQCKDVTLSEAASALIDKMVPDRIKSSLAKLGDPEHPTLEQINRNGLNASRISAEQQKIRTQCREKYLAASHRSYLTQTELLDCFQKTLAYVAGEIALATAESKFELSPEKSATLKKLIQDEAQSCTSDLFKGKTSIEQVGEIAEGLSTDCTPRITVKVAKLVAEDTVTQNALELGADPKDFIKNSVVPLEKDFENELQSASRRYKSDLHSLHEEAKAAKTDVEKEKFKKRQNLLDQKFEADSASALTKLEGRLTSQTFHWLAQRSVNDALKSESKLDPQWAGRFEKSLFEHDIPADFDAKLMTLSPDARNEYLFERQKQIIGDSTKSILKRFITRTYTGQRELTNASLDPNHKEITSNYLVDEEAKVFDKCLAGITYSKVKGLTKQKINDCSAIFVKAGAKNAALYPIEAMVGDLKAAKNDYLKPELALLDRCQEKISGDPTSPDFATQVSNCSQRASFKMAILAAREGAKSPGALLDRVPAGLSDRSSPLDKVKTIYDSIYVMCVYRGGQDCDAKVEKFLASIPDTNVPEKTPHPASAGPKEEYSATLTKTFINSAMMPDIVEASAASTMRSILNVKLRPYRNSEDHADHMDQVIGALTSETFVSRMLAKSTGGKQYIANIVAKMRANPKFSPGSDPQLESDFKKIMLEDSGPGSFSDLVFDAVASPEFDAYWQKWGTAKFTAAIFVGQLSSQSVLWGEVTKTPEGNTARDFFRSHFLVPIMDGQKISRSDYAANLKTLNSLLTTAAKKTPEK